MKLLGLTTLMVTLGLVLQTSVNITNATRHRHRVKQEVHIAPAGSNSSRLSAGVNPSGPNDGNDGIIVTPGNLDVAVNFPGGSSGGNPGPGPGPGPGNPPFMVPVAKGIECGSTVQMLAGNVAQVFSTNFGVANYQNYESCSWKFEANHCTLSAHCPCVEIPKSWECLGDYLRISFDFIRQNQRFCGGNRPGQPIYSESDSLNIKFRSDGRTTAAGFTCFVRCEGPGMTIPLMSNITCPTSLVFKG